MPALKGAAMGANHVVDEARCLGCGVGFAEDYDVEHRPDCTAEPSPLLCDLCDAIRLPSERRPVWTYRPNTRTYECPTHQKGTTP